MNALKEQLLKRTYSLLWRAGMMLAAIVINTIIENLSGLGLNPEIVLILGLVLGEVSKYLNNLISSEKVGF